MTAATASTLPSGFQAPPITLDSIEKDCNALNVLFQAIIFDMKVCLFAKRVANSIFSVLVEPVPVSETACSN
jgi:hypothetical protein